MKKLYLAVVLALNFGFDVSAAPLRINSEAKSFKYSKTVEKERPKLDEVTRRPFQFFQFRFFPHQNRVII